MEPIWTVTQVKRSNAGGQLFNAVKIADGTECDWDPTHSWEVANIRAQRLNHRDTKKATQCSFEAAYFYGPDEKYNAGRGLSCLAITEEDANSLFNGFVIRGENYALEIRRNGVCIRSHGPSIAQANASMNQAWKFRKAAGQISVPVRDAASVQRETIRELVAALRDLLDESNNQTKAGERARAALIMAEVQSRKIES